MFPANESPANAALRPAGLALFLFAMPTLFALAPTPTGLFGPLFALWWLAVNHRVVRPALGAAVVPSLVLAMSAWGLLGTLWAINAHVAAVDASLFLLECGPLTLFAAVCAGRPDLDRPALTKALLGGIAVAVLLLAVQTRWGFLFRSWLAHAPAVDAGLKLNVPTAALAILVWIAPALALRLSAPWRLVTCVALGLMAYSVWAGIGSAPRLAFIVGASTWACALVLPRLALYGLGVAVALIHFCAPFLGSSVWITQRVADLSWRHRIDIWEYCGQLIAERPWLGYGFKNSDYVPGGHWLMPLTHQPADLPSYPHNVLLQIQLEQGLPGVLIFYVALAYLLCRLARSAAVPRAAGLALLATGMSVWLVGYPLSRGHWVGWLCFAGIAWATTLSGGPTPVANKVARA